MSIPNIFSIGLSGRPIWYHLVFDLRIRVWNIFVFGNSLAMFFELNTSFLEDINVFFGFLVEFYIRYSPTVFFLSHIDSNTEFEILDRYSTKKVTFKKINCYIKTAGGHAVDLRPNKK